jgi:hypothetical protein
MTATKSALTNGQCMALGKPVKIGANNFPEGVQWRLKARVAVRLSSVHTNQARPN